MMMINREHGMMKVDLTKPKRRHFGRKEPKKEDEIVMHEVVDLSGMTLDTLPLSSKINLGMIYKLDISNNNLQVIPESLTARLLNVGVLDVHSNELKSLPNSIGCLSKLKTLNISGNHIQSLPKTIENCRCPVRDGDIEDSKHLFIDCPVACDLMDDDYEVVEVTKLPQNILGLLLWSDSSGFNIISKMCFDTVVQSSNKALWVGHPHSSATAPAWGMRSDRGRYLIPGYGTIDGLASPRHMGKFSPRRIFSGVLS
ncbi:leucine-rich repeat domain, L domain-like protein [Artemisia annua]|uniref:Leucine-rich repeat domain, L domain-like protein n=1 Tax=Artemisia annua TaxID=35608 RepID=A0A2U1K9V9_ARTAN|nr:leucine-rich repeat domain, L domain-like protein [Artemisia annua]